MLVRTTALLLGALSLNSVFAADSKKNGVLSLNATNGLANRPEPLSVYYTPLQTGIETLETINPFSEYVDFESTVSSQEYIKQFISAPSPEQKSRVATLIYDMQKYDLLYADYLQLALTALEDFSIACYSAAEIAKKAHPGKSLYFAPSHTLLLPSDETDANTLKLIRRGLRQVAVHALNAMRTQQQYTNQVHCYELESDSEKLAINQMLLNGLERLNQFNDLMVADAKNQATPLQQAEIFNLQNQVKNANNFYTHNQNLKINRALLDDFVKLIANRETVNLDDFMSDMYGEIKIISFDVLPDSVAVNFQFVDLVAAMVNLAPKFIYDLAKKISLNKYSPEVINQQIAAFFELFPSVLIKHFFPELFNHELKWMTETNLDAPIYLNPPRLAMTLEELINFNHKCLKRNMLSMGTPEIQGYLDKAAQAKDAKIELLYLISAFTRFLLNMNASNFHRQLLFQLKPGDKHLDENYLKAITDNAARMYQEGSMTKATYQTELALVTAITGKEVISGVNRNAIVEAANDLYKNYLSGEAKPKEMIYQVHQEEEYVPPVMRR
jgi:hypothetical protein